MARFAIYAHALCFSLSLANANISSAQRLHLNEISVEVKYDGTDLLGLLDNIERSSDFSFAYIKKDLRGKQIKLTTGQWNLNDLLKEISVQAKVSLRRVNANITIKQVEGGEELPFVSEELLADVKISGKVTDEKGEPLPGAAVLEKGTANGSITDIEGNYSLTLPSNATVIISFIGYETAEIQVSGRTVIDVSLNLDLLSLDEVVVVGYGTVKKSDLTGSVAQVELGQIRDIPANTVEGVLQGRAAGLQIISNSQDPGSSSIVRIRGGSSLFASSTPFIVVDGFPLGEAGDLKQINPADIASVEVLKDASASAIYGSRGANGVIMITTKKAKVGQTIVNVSQQTTVSEFTSDLNLWRDPAMMAQLNNESRINGGFPPIYVGAVSPSGIYYPSVEELSSGSWPTNTRWDDVVFRDAPVSNNTTISISSANEKTSINLSGNYYKEAGVQVSDEYSKLNYNFSIGHKLFDNLKVNFSNILTRGNRNNNGGLAYWRNPIFPIYNEDGSYFLANSNDFENPVAISANRLNKTKSIDVLTFVGLEWQVLPSISLTTRLNYKYATSLQDEYQPKVYTEAGYFNNGAGYIRNQQWNTTVSETFANFNKEISSHAFGATLGYSYQTDVNRTSDLTAFDFVNEALKNESLESGNPTQQQVQNRLNKSELVSGYFRVNYAFDNKYLFTFTSRADGSSKFGANNKWAYFPSGAVSWKLHEENFLKSNSTISELKLRASYGISGNQAINPYESLSRFGISKYYNDGTWVTSIGPGRDAGRAGQGGINVLWGGIASPDLRWETTTQMDIGLDLGLMQGRFHLTADYYDKQTNDLLQQRLLASSSGYDLMVVNSGAVNNKGVELTLNADIVSTSDLQVSTTFIYSRNRSKVTDLGKPEETGLFIDSKTGMQYQYYKNSIEMYRDNPNILGIGQPVNAFYGYKTDGIVQTLEEGALAGLEGNDALPGEFKYVDINDDGVIDANDKTIIGNPNPDFMASMNLSVTYKKIDFSMFLNGVFGNDVLNTQAFNQPSNQPLRWTPDNPTNDYPSLRDGRQSKVSDWWIQDGSFVRIQNMSLGYNIGLPKQMKARVYVNASNLYTFTKFKGYDPEVGTDGRYNGGYPRLRKWTIGLNLTF